jgi:hypothetical protein
MQVNRASLALPSGLDEDQERSEIRIEWLNLKNKHCMNDTIPLCVYELKKCCWRGRRLDEVNIRVKVRASKLISPCAITSCAEAPYDLAFPASRSSQIQRSRTSAFERGSDKRAEEFRLSDISQCLVIICVQKFECPSRVHSAYQFPGEYGLSLGGENMVKSWIAS